LGSEWVVDAGEARRSTADWADTPHGRQYLSVVDAGIPEGTAGMSLGLDRLLMYLLGLGGVADAVPAPRTSRSFRSAPSIPDAASSLVEPRRPRPDPDAVRRSGAALVRLIS